MSSFAAAAQQGVLHELWEGVPGDTVGALTASPAYRRPASQVRVLRRMEAASLGDGYGARFTGLLTPPRTGAYTFWLASDDGGELWVSADSTAGRLRRVARVQGYTEPGTYDAQPGQRSAPISLRAGRTYLVRALHKQGGGGNHLAVAWSGPGIARQPIPADRWSLPPLQPGMAARIARAREADRRRDALVERAGPYWRAGKTLPVEFAKALPVGPAPDPATDTGINVLVDQAHQTQFVVIWGLTGEARGQGFRVCSSLASLDTVLTPGKPSRIRLPIGSDEPFAWWPTPEWNVVVTSQQDLDAQVYTQAERAALLRFVRAGGGLMVFGGTPRTPDRAAGWSLNRFMAALDAEYVPQTDRADGRAWPSLRLGSAWQVNQSGEAGRPLRARRTFDKGRVMVVEGPSVFLPDDKGDRPGQGQAKRALLAQSLKWLAGGKPPVRGEGRMANTGGAGIFPELELNTGGIVVYYAGNQPAPAMECIRRDIPRGASQVLQWLPTPQFAEPYCLVICAGGGGGWAINPRPKASAVIEYEPRAILGVFGHEFAHTMSGPPGATGVVAGRSPHGNQGESHAGWFQGKLDAFFEPSARGRANRDCNSILDLEARKGARLDLATENETEAGRARWGKGPEWTKQWWVFQKLDDRFGPTWYPRWYWVRNTRWAATPGRELTWDETVEDMSIAVGEDLFPFFRKIGTTLTRDRLESIAFQGRVLNLPVCPLDDGPAGPVNLEAIGDYTRPLTPRG